MKSSVNNQVTSKLLVYSKLDLELLKIYDCRNRSKTVSKNQDYKICSDDVLTIIKRQKRKCFYCNDFLKPKEYQIDHFYPKSMGGKTVINNLVATCRWCNTMKNALDGYSFIGKCKKIVDNNCLKSIIEFSTV